MGQAAGKEKQDDTVDGGALVPQGVYTAEQDFNHAIVKQFIHARKLAPFYKGRDDEQAYQSAPYNTECPICFLYYPSPLNHTRCCDQPICTECFVQIKRADPNHTNPPSSEPAACPYCMRTDFGIVYRPPVLRPAASGGGHAVGAGAGAVGTSADAAAGAGAVAGETSAGSGGASANRRRKSFGHTDPEVITIDAIRPDWQAKLAAAQAATMRRANRRIIMRRVGDRLIPIGVSSSRLGAELGEGAGPGGAIILQEGESFGQQRRANAGSGGSGSGGGGGGGGGEGEAEGRGSERRSRRGRQLAQYLATLGDGPDMEELMMMEAMRLSLLEHEEQQRRQAAAAQQAAAAAAAATAAAEGGPRADVQGAETSARTTAASNVAPGSSSVEGTGASGRTQPPARDSDDVPLASLPPSAGGRGTVSTAPAVAAVGATTAASTAAVTPALAGSTSPNPVSSAASGLPRAAASSVAPVDLGLSPSMMAELSELVEGSPAASAATVANAARGAAAAPTTTAPRPSQADEAVPSQAGVLPPPWQQHQQPPVGGDVPASRAGHSRDASTASSHGGGRRSGGPSHAQTVEPRSDSPFAPSSPASSAPPSGFAAATAQPGQHGASPATRTSGLNPNNPFRRSGGGGAGGAPASNVGGG